MNVLVVNQQEEVLSSLNIEVIKTLRGTFSSDEIISTFTNFFFVRMIIDITALQNSEDIVTYQKLSIGLPIDKIILLIPPSSVVANNYFLSKLISMGYYNFTTNGEGVMYLLSTPNTYKEVAHLHQVGGMGDMPPNQPMVQSDNSGGFSQSNYPMNGQNNNQMMPQPQAPMNDYSMMPQGNTGYRVKSLGVVNVTDSSGASSLIYMMKKELEETFGASVLAIEVDKRDFSFFREQNMISTTKSSLAREIMQAVGYGCVLVDLNDYEDPVCEDVIYLIEPSVIKLNKLMLRDRSIFQKLKGKKVIINRSTLSEADVKEFASEAGIDIFYVLPPLNDRERSGIIADLIRRLGIANK
jgi:hypothetical protein